MSDNFSLLGFLVWLSWALLICCLSRCLQTWTFIHQLPYRLIQRIWYRPKPQLHFLPKSQALCMLQLIRHTPSSHKRPTSVLLTAKERKNSKGSDSKCQPTGSVVDNWPACDLKQIWKSVQIPCALLMAPTLSPLKSKPYYLPCWFFYLMLNFENSWPG